VALFLAGSFVVVAPPGRCPSVSADAPRRSALHDPAVKQALPFSGELKQAIYKKVNASLSGQMSPADALNKADSQINLALTTF
jgi:hypothetical protein